MTACLTTRTESCLIKGKLLYDPSKEGMWAKFSDLPIGSSFTSKDNPGNVFKKTGEHTCQCTDFNIDDDLISYLHGQCGGIAYNVCNQTILVNGDYSVLIYQRIERPT